MSRIGDASMPAIRVMFELARHADDSEQIATIRAISRMDAYGVQSVALLVDAIDAKEISIEVKTEIYRVLGLIGPHAAAAVPGLMGVVRDANPTARRSNARLELPEPDDDGSGIRSARATAIEALGQIGPVAAAAVPTLLANLQTSDEWIRLEAIRALGGIGPASLAAVPALIQVVGRNRNASKRNHILERRAAIEALGRIGPAAAAAAPVLSDLLKNGVPFEAETVWAMARIEKGIGHAVRRDVEKRMESHPQSLQTRLEVSAALGKNCPELERYKRLLVDQLERDLSAFWEDEWGVWIEFVASDLRRLTVFGRGSAEVFRSLFKLRDHPQPLVRRWIRETITRIQGL